MNSVFALIFVLGLIGAATVALRYFGTEKFIRKHIVKGDRKRLTIVDAINVDARRRLLLVRRDNVEHLILIGPERDKIIERNIKKSSRKN